MRRLLLIFAALFLITSNVMAKDVYHEKLMKLISMTPTDSMMSEKIIPLYTELLVKRDSISEKKAKKKVRNFFYKDIIPTTTNIIEKHFRGNITEGQLDEAIAFYEANGKELLGRIQSIPFDDVTVKEKYALLLKSIIPQIIKGEPVKIQIDSIPTSFQEKYRNVGSMFKINQKITKAFNQAMSLFPRIDDKARTSMNYILNFFEDNADEITISLLYGKITEKDLDCLNDFYSTNTGKAYIDIYNAMSDELLTVTMNKTVEFLKPIRK